MQRRDFLKGGAGLIAAAALGSGISTGVTRAIPES